MSLGVELHKWKVQSNSDSPNRIHVGRFRDAEFEQKMAEVLCVYRGPGSEQSRRQVAQSHPASGDRFLRRNAGNPGHRATAPDLPPKPGVHATLARYYEYKRHVDLGIYSIR